MKEYTITYHLTPEQETAVRGMADEDGKTTEELFELIMTAGSRWDIDKKVEVWKQLVENGKQNRAAQEGVNYQIMPTPDADGKYTPNYHSLIGRANCDEETEYIRSVKARDVKFAYNMVYVIRLVCGHYEIFQTPQNEHYPLEDIITRAKDYAKTSKCTHCICNH